MRTTLCAGPSSCTRSPRPQPGSVVKISLLEETRIRYEPTPGPLTVDAPAADRPFTPFQMVASGLAACTYAILASWGEHADLRADDLSLEVAWAFEEKPHRVGRFDLTFAWPSLPAARLEAAKRVAAMCPVHVTLERPPAMTIAGTAGSAEAPPAVPAPVAEPAAASAAPVVAV